MCAHSPTLGYRNLPSPCYPDEPRVMHVVHGRADLLIIDDPIEPFLRITFPGLPPVDITTNIAEMIGGAGAGCRKRYGY